MKKEEQNPPYFKKAFHLIKDYFLNSDEKLIAWLLLIGAILSVVALVGLIAVFSWWSVGFWAALAAKDITLFLFNMGVFALTVSAYVGVNVLKNYLVDVLSIRWRNWLTQKFITKYIHADSNYLDIARLSAQIENPEQRIQEDIKIFVDLSLSLILDSLKSTLSFITFVGTLWVIGGALTVVVMGANIVIPGYLVWLALIISIVATLVTHVLGKSLTTVNQKEESLEANFRKDMEFLTNDSESIAQEHSENYHKKLLTGDVQEISNNAYQKVSVNTKLIAFQSVYSQISEMVPYMLAAPLYFSGAIELGQLMQIGMAFFEVNNSLSWFVNSYDTLAKYQVSVKRIIELEKAFEVDGLESTKKNIVIKEHNTDQLEVKELNIAYPSSTESIMRQLNLTFKRGENTLIKGPSGLGKSTLFKAIAGTWKYGDGEISIPHDRKIYFLPQKPSLPHDTLKAVLAYPEPIETYTEEQYISALRSVGGMDKFISELDQKFVWSKRLSPGQQQRISFARSLLKKPDWLFLDEATASLDPVGERHVYSLVKNQLVNTTFISIAHRPTVEEFHDRIVNFEINLNKEIAVKEEKDKPDQQSVNDSDIQEQLSSIRLESSPFATL